MRLWLNKIQQKKTVKSEGYETGWVAALPMYDWPEMHDEVDAQWARLRTLILQHGIPAPETLVRRNADMPPVSGGIRDASDTVVAADPATLPPDELDLPTLWRHPRLLFGQTCWGPMETTGLNGQVRVLGQPSYDGIEGGSGDHYSSAIVMRRGSVTTDHVHAPEGDMPLIPLDLVRDKRLAFNSHDSMSGFIGISRDLAALGEGLRIFSDRIESGGHRNSIVAIADGRGRCRSHRLPELGAGAAFRTGGARGDGCRLDRQAQGPALHHCAFVSADLDAGQGVIVLRRPCRG
jgi:ABC-type phosphate/phosphonate transport system substrate-binding protein